MTALVLAGLATAATMTASPALASPPKRHYIGSCQASGDYPTCSIDARTAWDPREIDVRVWGTITIPVEGRGRIEAQWDTVCDRGTGSGDDSGAWKLFPSYTRPLRQAYAKASECYSSATISPVNYEGSGTVHAYMYYTRRDGR